MNAALVDQAIELLEKANAELEPELLPAPVARRVLKSYARAKALAEFGVAALSRKVDDPLEVSRATGTSVGRAKAVVATGKALASSDELNTALQTGAISLDQAAEIAPAAESVPGSAPELLRVATEGSFQVLKEKARRTMLESEQHRGLALRQREARRASSHTDALGMIHLHIALEPHVGTPVVNRAEAEASRRHRMAKRDGNPEPFERHLADAYAAILSGSPVPARPNRPELVVLVSHEVAKRGWKDVRPGEVCKIPGVGPVSPQVAKEIADDAFLSGVFYDGVDLRHFTRWSRAVPTPVRVALELGEPPEFDGVKCVDCGRRFRCERDHVVPRAARGPTSTGNLRYRCHECHEAKTARDRKAGRLKPPEP